MLTLADTYLSAAWHFCYDSGQPYCVTDNDRMPIDLVRSSLTVAGRSGGEYYHYVAAGDLRAQLTESAAKKRSEKRKHDGRAPDEAAPIDAYPWLDGIDPDAMLMHRKIANFSMPNM